MAIGTSFGSLHSGTDLHLVQQQVEVGPAAPKTNFKDVPGADGSLDMTEALGVGVKYKDRTIKWTFGLYPGDDWALKRTQVNNAINGIRCHIIIDGDTGYYYDGRVEVTDHKTNGRLHQIAVRAVCKPFRYKATETEVSRSDLSTSLKTLNLTNGGLPIVPEITVGQQTTVQWNSTNYTLNAGTHVLPDVIIPSGSSQLKAKVASGSGSISVKFREVTL